MNILFASSEAHPLIKTGGLADVAGSLPRALRNLKQDIRERHNLAEQNPGKLQELHRILNEWRRTIGAPIPSQPNPEFDPKVEKEAIERSIKN